MILAAEISVKLLVFLFFLSFFLFSACCQSSPGRGETDLILFNGSVWTANPGQPRAEAVAVESGKICAVGSSKDILALRGRNTRIIDCRGFSVLPGFIDCHAHFLNGGFSFSGVRLYSARSKEEFVSRIREKAWTLSPGEWILNGDWDHQKFDPPGLPDKEWIDSVTPDHPVWINRHDGHMALANSLALKKAGVTRDTRSPSGGKIVRDPRTGEPTGILKDAAMELVASILPSPSPEKIIAAARAALEHAAGLGITSIHDMNFEVSHEALTQLRRSEGLTARLYGYVPIDRPEVFSAIRSKLDPDDVYLRLGGFKGFVDGSLGSSTALFFEPYTDDPETSGFPAVDMAPEGVMEERIRMAERNGHQVAVHAIGDRANNMLLDMYERIFGSSKNRDRRWRVEHAQHLLPGDAERFAKAGIIASVQPFQVIDDGRWAEKKIGHRRARFAYAFKSLLEKGTRLAMGSDWTVAPMDPLKGIYAAVSRRTLDGKNPEGWFPEQKISLEEAIKGYTLNGAFAEFSEKTKGTVEKGKMADLVILDADLFRISVEDILGTCVLKTVLGGRVVYEKENDGLGRPLK